MSDAVSHPGHFAVMFRPDLVDPEDPELVRASSASAAMLYGPVDSVATIGGDAAAQRIAATAAWALVHGIATLWLQGSLRGDPDGSMGDPETPDARRRSSPLRTAGLKARSRGLGYGRRVTEPSQPSGPPPRHRSARWSLPARAGHRSRRDGHDLSGHRHPPGAPGRGQDPASRGRDRSRPRPAVPARGARRDRPPPPEHRRLPGHRHGRRPGLPRDGPRRWRGPGRAAPAWGPARPVAGGAHRARCRPRPGRRPRARHRPSRHQARQHPARGRRPGDGHRLRDRPAGRGRGGRAARHDASGPSTTSARSRRAAGPRLRPPTSTASGLVLFEALTGTRAWTGDTTDAIALARVGAPAPSPRAVRPEVPAALEAVVRRALAPEPGDRYPNGTAMAAALEPIVNAADVGKSDERRARSRGPVAAGSTGAMRRRSAARACRRPAPAPRSSPGRPAPRNAGRSSRCPERSVAEARSALLVAVGIVGVVASALLVAATAGRRRHASDDRADRAATDTTGSDPRREPEPTPGPTPEPTPPPVLRPERGAAPASRRRRRRPVRDLLRHPVRAGGRPLRAIPVRPGLRHRARRRLVECQRTRPTPWPSRRDEGVFTFAGRVVEVYPNGEQREPRDTRPRPHRGVHRHRRRRAPPARPTSASMAVAACRAT